jgi:stage II sporulation protein M
LNRKKNKVPQHAAWMLLILAVTYLAGVLFGQALAGSVSPDLQAELDHYLADYLLLDREQIAATETAWNTAILYIRYPLMAFLLGFASVGVFLLPVVAFLFGLGLSFSVGCFTAAFASDGMLLCCASFGLRVLVTLPCFLTLAVPAWEASRQLLLLSFGRGRRSAAVMFGKPYWLRFAIVLGILLAGVCADLLLTPWFLDLVLT